jgi:O-antigen/teichoic acid export membrane protein
MEKTTAQRVRGSVVSMFVARPISALGGFLLLVVLSRALSASDYGFYFGLWASAEILILASNFGLLYAVYRYVSASELLDGKLLPRGPVLPLLGWRVVTLCLAAIGAAVFPKMLTSFAGMPPLLSGLPLMFAAIVFGEGLARFIESIFDSMLSQGRSQATLVTRTIFRLLGFLYFIEGGSLTLNEVVMVEVVAALSGACLGLLLLGQIYWHANRMNAIVLNEIHRLGSMVKFALPAFIAQLLTLVYGPNALKIILTKTAGLEAVAVFGFAYSLAAVIQRYMPVNLFAGVFRPVFVAASKKVDSEVLLAGLFNLIIKINWLVILPIFCVLAVEGSRLLSGLSGGKYANSGGVLLILIGVLLPLVFHFTLSMFCLARENSLYPLYSTVLAVIGLPIGIYLSEKYGAEGISVALGVSECIWSATCLFLLKRVSRETIRLDWSGLVRMLGASALAIAVGFGLDNAGVNWYLVAPVVALTCLLGVHFLSVFSLQEKKWLIGILPLGQRAAMLSKYL